MSDASGEVETLKTLLVEARVAVRDADYETAYSRLLEASVIYDTLPNYEQDGVRMEWRNAEALMRRIEKLRDRAAGHGKVKRVNVTHNRPDTGEDYWCR